MALRDFWISVRTGARLIAPTATADSPRLDSAKIERILRGATIWLTPRSVHGFDASDFDFLTEAERNQLSKSVERFREIASQVPPDKPATPQQIQQALPEFLRILEVLRPDKYADPEALVVGKRVENIVSELDVKRWPYVRFRTISELEPPAKNVSRLFSHV
jgi:hypothetical protein